MATPSKNKNNPDNRVKKKQNKIMSSIDCDRCKEKCAEYQKYIDRLKSGKILKGIVCKK